MSPDVCDSLFSEIPILGMFRGYAFHPEYLGTQEDGTAVMRLKKEPAFSRANLILKSSVL
jgi:hypothetical protein